MEKILIIDDDVTFSLMLRTWLGKKGFGVDTAADIAAGRRLLAEGSYDLVLSDMRLPDGDGTDLLQAQGTMFPNPFSRTSCSARSARRWMPRTPKRLCPHPQRWLRRPRNRAGRGTGPWTKAN